MTDALLLVDKLFEHWCIVCIFMLIAGWALIGLASAFAQFAQIARPRRECSCQCHKDKKEEKEE